MSSVEDYISSCFSARYEFESETAFANLSYFANHPTLEALKMFADFRFYNGTVSHLAMAKPIKRYIFHPKMLKEDFYGCRWRVGFIRNFFKIPLPYYTLFRILMKMTL